MLDAGYCGYWVVVIVVVVVVVVVILLVLLVLLVLADGACCLLGLPGGVWLGSVAGRALKKAGFSGR
jgi:hypothetical protein